MIQGIAATVLTLMMFSACALGCSGDCILCHPKLIKKDGKMDADHQVLGRCKVCHQDRTRIEIIDNTVSELNRSNIRLVKYDENNISANTAHTECGSDCWQCHDITKVSHIPIREHKVLNRCIECHVSIDKNFLKKSSESSLDTLGYPSIPIGKQQ